MKMNEEVPVDLVPFEIGETIYLKKDHAGDKKGMKAVVLKHFGERGQMLLGIEGREKEYWHHSYWRRDKYEIGDRVVINSIEPRWSKYFSVGMAATVIDIYDEYYSLNFDGPMPDGGTKNRSFKKDEMVLYFKYEEKKPKKGTETMNRIDEGAVVAVARDQISINIKKGNVGRVESSDDYITYVRMQDGNRAGSVISFYTKDLIVLPATNRVPSQSAEYRKKNDADKVSIGAAAQKKMTIEDFMIGDILKDLVTNQYVRVSGMKDGFMIIAFPDPKVLGHYVAQTCTNDFDNFAVAMRPKRSWREGKCIPACASGIYHKA